VVIDRWLPWSSGALVQWAPPRGPASSTKRFLDELHGVGMITVTLVYQELTGDDRMVQELKDGVTPRPFRIR
jgi:hypothetical protein